MAASRSAGTDSWWSASNEPWEDGTCGLLLSPLELIERLAALVPAPRAHRVHYHGVFAPAASWRCAIVPTPPARERRLPGYAWS
jgi:hypothetical protein